MPKLTDTQAVLLASASQREDGHLLPPPETLGALDDRIRTAIAALLKQGLADEAAVSATDRAWRQDDDSRIGAVVTAAGLQAIGVEQVDAWLEKGDQSDAGQSSGLPTGPAPVQQTKASLVLDLLRREQGATLAELVTATGWLPHTTRAALTGIRKKGHSLAKSKRDEVTCYSLESAA